MSLAGRGGRGAGGGAGEAGRPEGTLCPRPRRSQRAGGLCVPQAAVSALVVVSEQAREFRSVVELSERCDAGGDPAPTVSRARIRALGTDGGCAAPLSQAGPSWL